MRYPGGMLHGRHIARLLYRRLTRYRCHLARLLQPRPSPRRAAGDAASCTATSDSGCRGMAWHGMAATRRAVPPGSRCAVGTAKQSPELWDDGLRSPRHGSALQWQQYGLGTHRFMFL